MDDHQIKRALETAASGARRQSGTDEVVRAASRRLRLRLIFVSVAALGIVAASVSTLALVLPAVRGGEAKPADPLVTASEEPGWPSGAGIVLVRKGSEGNSLVQLDEQGDEVILANLPGNAFAPALSWEGDRVAYSLATSEGSARLEVLEVAGGDTRMLISDLGTINSVAWSPDDGTIVVTVGAGDIYSVDVATGEARPVARQVRAAEAAVSVEGAIAFTTTSGEVILLDEGDPVTVFDGRGSNYPAWSPDGASLAFSRFDGAGAALEVLTVSSSAVRTLADASQGHNTSPVWSPDGRFIAYRSDRDDRESIRLIDVSTAEETELMVFPTEPELLAWLADQA